MIRFIRLVVTIGALLASVSASAQSRVVVLGFESDDPTLRRDVNEGAVAGAARVGPVVDQTDVPLSDTLQLIGCSGADTACLSDLADLLECDVLVLGSVVPGSPALVGLSVFDVRAGRTVVSTRSTLPRSGVSEHVATRVAAFLSGLALVDITSEDGPGVVSVDGVRLGPLPVLAAPLSVGVHDVQVDFDDGRTSRLNTTVDSVGESVLVVRAQGRVPRVERSGEGVRAARVAGWSAVAGGAAALGVAAVYGARANDAASALANTPLERRAHRIASEGRADARAANACLGVGAALLVGGATAVVIDRLSGGRTDQRVAVSFAPTPGGGVAGFVLGL